MGKTAVEIATVLIEALDDKEIEAVRKIVDGEELGVFGVAGADILKEIIRLTDNNE
jgi:hypothetical protein|tara:strand:- start:759 stop:926 length:168 start_codon:yes stop_codon:yes gene_type:complete